MVPALRTVLLGRSDSRARRNRYLLLAAGILLATFGAYALGLFRVTGCVVFLPGDASALGFLVAVGIGARRGGLLFAWLVQYAAYVGFRADWGFLGLSSHSLAGKLAFLLDPVGLAVLGVAAIVVGTAGYGVGYLGRWSVLQVRDTLGTDSS